MGEKDKRKERDKKSVPPEDAAERAKLPVSSKHEIAPLEASGTAYPARANPAHTSPIQKTASQVVSSQAVPIGYARPIDEPVPAWKQGLKRGWMRFRFVAVPALLWIVLSKYQIVNLEAKFAGDVVTSITLFVLGIPVTLLLRLDRFYTQWALDEGRVEVALIIALAMVFVNFLLVGAGMGWLRAKRMERDSRKGSAKK